NAGERGCTRGYRGRAFDFAYTPARICTAVVSSETWNGRASPSAHRIAIIRLPPCGVCRMALAAMNVAPAGRDDRPRETRRRSFPAASRPNRTVRLVPRVGAAIRLDLSIDGVPKPGVRA